MTAALEFGHYAELGMMDIICSEAYSLLVRVSYQPRAGWNS